MFPDLPGHWYGIRDGDPRGRDLYNRHYSAHKYKDGRLPKLFAGPGQKMCLLTIGADALFVWRKFKDASGQQGVNCAVFRNESAILSSLLIQEAVDMAWARWPGERLYTYVKASVVQSSNPGYCFTNEEQSPEYRWKKCGTTKWNKLLILELLPPIIMPEAA